MEANSPIVHRPSSIIHHPCLGVTFVELIVSIAVLSIIAGIDVALLRTGLEAWTYGSTRLALQRVGEKVMSELLEGGVEGDGIQDGVELKEAGLTSVGFVPLWTDRSHEPDRTRNREQKFILARQFKPGASTPIAQAKPPGAEAFETYPVRFYYGDSRDPKRPDDVVQVSKPIPEGAELKFLYTPDAENDPEVIKYFRWDPATRRVYATYAGSTQDLLKDYDGVRITRCAFLYYDNLNRLIPMPESRLSSLSVKRATAVKIYLVLERGEEFKEMTSFTNIRNVSTIGATVSEGAQLPMPTPDKVKAFSIGDFYGLKREGIVELVVRTPRHKGLKIWLKFKAAASESDLLLERFRMESPPGKILTSAILEQTIAANEFVSLLTLDRTGLYDYDDDEDIKDIVEVTGPNPVVTVERLDFEGASLFIRP